MEPTHATPTDVAGERSREEHAPAAPAPNRTPPHEGRDVNDLDDLESSSGRFLGEPLGQPARPK
jgi:hypothetical protein